MHWRYLTFALLTCFFWAAAAFAHPVTYTDGWAVMNWQKGDTNDLHIQHSLSNRHAVALGYSTTKDADNDRSHFLIPRVNYLLQRWNKPSWQANVYVSGGLGGRVGEGDDALSSAFSFQADAESRRLYNLIHTEQIVSADDRDYLRVSYRAGVAPYLAEYKELQTFIIAEVSYEPEMKDEWTAGPVLRLFKGDILVEFGIRNNGELQSTFMLHF